jgi:glycerate 2-kinase
VVRSHAVPDALVPRPLGDPESQDHGSRPGRRRSFRARSAGRQLSALAAPDKFRGTLTAREAAGALAAGLRDAGIAEVDELPLADGGEGTLDAILAAREGERYAATVTGPAGPPVLAEWGLLSDGTAVIELAEASGLALAGATADPVKATTRGTGELIVVAARAGAARVLLGVGGSATTDGGLGAVEALGWSLPVPVTVACDVDTRFLDAARVFGPQKGASPDQVELLIRRLEELAVLYRDRTGVDVTRSPGSGAAGGFAGGLAALGAELRPGFAVVADAVGFSQRLGRAQLVLTGEGRLDGTSLTGKVVGEVVRAAEAQGIRAMVVVGEVDEDVRDRLPGRPAVASLTDFAGSRERAHAEAAQLVRLAARRLVTP